MSRKEDKFNILLAIPSPAGQSRIEAAIHAYKVMEERAPIGSEKRRFYAATWAGLALLRKSQDGPKMHYASLQMYVRTACGGPPLTPSQQTEVMEAIFKIALPYVRKDCLTPALRREQAKARK